MRMKKFLVGSIRFAIVYFLLDTCSSILFDDQHFKEMWGKAAIVAIATGLVFELFFQLLLEPLLRYLKKSS